MSGTTTMQTPTAGIRPALGTTGATPTLATPRRVLLLADARDAYHRGVIRGVLAHADGRSVAGGGEAPWRIEVAVEGGIAAVRDWSGIDGVISALDDARLAAGLASAGTPAVNVSPAATAAWHLSVIPDEVSVARAAAEHLLACGLAGFAWCGGHVPRYGEAFIAALRAGGHDGEVRRIAADVSEGALVTWLADLAKPTGILTCDDRTARRILEVSRGLGMRVPEDLAIVGIGDDTVVCEPSLPPLSSVALPGEQVGAEAAGLLAQLMTGAPAARPRPVPTAGVVARRSSDALATGDPRIDDALRFIGRNAAGRIGVADVLAVTGGSRRTLEARFRRLLHRSPAEEIRRVRLALAKRLLAQTELPIGEIATRCGFSGLKHLCEAFTREEGLSAGRYRRRFRSWRVAAAG